MTNSLAAMATSNGVPTTLVLIGGLQLRERYGVMITINH